MLRPARPWCSWLSAESRLWGCLSLESFPGSSPPCSPGILSLSTGVSNSGWPVLALDPRSGRQGQEGGILPSDHPEGLFSTHRWVGIEGHLCLGRSWGGGEAGKPRMSSPLASSQGHRGLTWVPLVPHGSSGLCPQGLLRSSSMETGECFSTWVPRLPA